MLFKELVKCRVNMIEAMGWYGVNLRRQGNGDNYMGHCPFHDDRHPSLSVHGSKKLFHCFGCGAGGDIFKFVMLVEKVSFSEAVRKLAQKYGL